MSETGALLRKGERNGSGADSCALPLASVDEDPINELSSQPSVAGLPCQKPDFRDFLLRCKALRYFQVSPKHKNKLKHITNYIYYIKIQNREQPLMN